MRSPKHPSDRVRLARIERNIAQIQFSVAALQKALLELARTTNSGSTCIETVALEVSDLRERVDDIEGARQAGTYAFFVPVH